MITQSLASILMMLVLMLVVVFMVNPIITSLVNQLVATSSVSGSPIEIIVISAKFIPAVLVIGLLAGIWRIISRLVS